jgi:hypothetical protein
MNSLITFLAYCVSNSMTLPCPHHDPHCPRRSYPGIYIVSQPVRRAFMPMHSFAHLKCKPYARAGRFGL